MKKAFLISLIYIFCNGCTDNSVSTTSPAQSVTDPVTFPLQNNTSTTVPVDTSQAITLITQKCTYCHSLTPNSASGYRTAPEGIIFDTQAQMVSRASLIKMETVIQRRMPERPVTITEEERALIGAWADQQ